MTLVDLSGIPDQPVNTEEVRSVLLNDLADCWLELKNRDTQTLRRNYARATFAFIEGFVSIMKSGSLAVFLGGGCSLTPGDLSLLLEKTYSLSETGEVNSRDVYVPTAQGVRFAFDVFGRAHGIAERPDYSGDGWRHFRRALEVRNRVTHPKAATDLAINDKELNAIDGAWRWFLDASFVVYAKGRAALIARLESVPGLKLVLPPEQPL